MSHNSFVSKVNFHFSYSGNSSSNTYPVSCNILIEPCQSGILANNLYTNQGTMSSVNVAPLNTCNHHSPLLALTSQWDALTWRSRQSGQALNATTRSESFIGSMDLRQSLFYQWHPQLPSLSLTPKTKQRHV